jgi:hypothetical protein
MIEIRNELFFSCNVAEEKNKRHWNKRQVLGRKAKNEKLEIIVQKKAISSF